MRLIKSPMSLSIHSLIRPFVIRIVDNMMFIVSLSLNSSLLVDYVAKQTDLCLIWSVIRTTGLPTNRLVCNWLTLVRSGIITGM